MFYVLSMRFRAVYFVPRGCPRLPRLPPRGATVRLPFSTRARWDGEMGPDYAIIGAALVWAEWCA